jgi:hypothetical protein
MVSTLKREASNFFWQRATTVSAGQFADLSIKITQVDCLNRIIV